jgi:hypothetical protein
MVRKPNLHVSATHTAKASGLQQKAREERTRADVANHKLARIKSLVAAGVWGHTTLCLQYQEEAEKKECICRMLSHNLQLDRISDVLEGVD